MCQDEIRTQEEAFMIVALTFDLEKTADETGYARAARAEDYVLALYDIKKRLSEIDPKATKANLMTILGEIYAAVAHVGI